ncbi:MULTISPECIES: serine hydrolase [unclassified Bradyrhizobium]|uniref:serine hydrolase domain-containing protein n=1 Tax=unclassified Bradyrhizobium TaxID=2631580 RepID=UPI002916FCF6|nr:MULTISPECIES: serine hydrolase [unclassified Bradyrhizobium]
MLDRREVIAGATATLAAGDVGLASSAAPAGPWQKAAPTDAGLTADLAPRLDRLIADKRVWGLHGVLVVRHRRIALERYFEAEDNNWGQSLGLVRFGPDTLHNLYSATKSIVALLYGIALADGKVPPPNAPLYAQFPEYQDLVAADERRRQQTVGHALSMSLGTRWNEIGLAYDSPDNDEIGMEMAEDRYRFVLERPVIGPPGKRWQYSGGATALLGRLIAKGTGRSLPDYARTALFDPLGIGRTEWITSSETWVGRQRGSADGEPVAASGLRMTLHDLARIGQLVMDDGKVGARQVVPADWLTECFVPRVSVNELQRYGYQWYLGDMEFRAGDKVHLEHWVGAAGNGGQRLYVMPDLDLIVVVMAGNYSAPDQWMPPIRVVREAVLPSLLM